MTVTPMITRRALASELLDTAVRSLRLISAVPEGTDRVTRRRAGQMLRLASQQINNGDMTLDEGLAWLDAGRVTLKRWEAS
jgi:hypothetical protein